MPSGSPQQDIYLVGLCGVIALICALLIWRGLKTGVPPGQKGLKGTPLEHSRSLMIVQVTLLVVMMVSAVAAGVFLMLRH